MSVQFKQQLCQYTYCTRFLSKSLNYIVCIKRTIIKKAIIWETIILFKSNFVLYCFLSISMFSSILACFSSLCVLQLCWQQFIAFQVQQLLQVLFIDADIGRCQYEQNNNNYSKRFSKKNTLSYKYFIITLEYVGRLFDFSHGMYIAYFLEL